MNEPVVILGGGGHARVVLDTLRCLGWPVLGVLVPDLAPGSDWHGVKVLGDDDWLASPVEAACAIGIGAVPGRMALRQTLFARAIQLGRSVPSLIHPAAFVSRAAQLQAGVQIMAGAVIQPGVCLAANALVNTGARIDHDCTVGTGAHLAPGAILCGNVRIGVSAFVGAGAVVLPGVTVGDGAEIAAGATVTQHVPPWHRYIPGHPLKPLGGHA